MFPFLFFSLLLVIFVFAAGWLLVFRLLVKRPLLGALIPLYAGLAVWLGANDAQALMCYALVAVLMWRLAHKRSFERFVGRRLRRPCGRPPAAPPPPEDPMGRIRTVG
jgi:hypothetical protein